MKSLKKYFFFIKIKRLLALFSIILFGFINNSNYFINAYATNESLLSSTYVDEIQDQFSTSLSSCFDTETSEYQNKSIAENIENTNNQIEINIESDIVIPIIIEFLGAFLGVISAIWLSKKDARKKKKELDSSLQNELKAIYDDLKDYLSKQSDEFYRYDTTIWDINLASGAFNELDYETYAKYIAIYSKIKYAQEIEREWSHSFIISNSSKVVDNFIKSANNERKRLGQEILDAIKKLVGEE